MSGKSSTTAYDPHPSIRMVQNVIAAMKEKTGRSLDEWVTHVKSKGPADEPGQREWLKAQGLGTNYAWWIAERANGRGGEDVDPKAYLRAAAGYVEAMYSGGKAGLRPLHDALVKLGRSIANDVKVSPCKTIVPFFRLHVFAQIKPASAKRIDFGFALGALKGSGRLEETGGFAKKDRITHRIAITSLDDIDDEVVRWLKAAYELDAPGASKQGDVVRFNIKRREPAGANRPGRRTTVSKPGPRSSKGAKPGARPGRASKPVKKKK